MAFCDPSTTRRRDHPSGWQQGCHPGATFPPWHVFPERLSPGNRHRPACRFHAPRAGHPCLGRRPCVVLRVEGRRRLLRDRVMTRGVAARAWRRNGQNGVPTGSPDRPGAPYRFMRRHLASLSVTLSSAPSSLSRLPSGLASWGRFLMVSSGLSKSSSRTRGQSSFLGEIHTVRHSAGPCPHLVPKEGVPSSLPDTESCSPGLKKNRP